MVIRRALVDMMEDFSRWLDWVFDHEVPAAGEMPWHLRAGAQIWDAEAHMATALAHVTRLFSQPDILVGRYDADRIAQGLWFLIDPSYSSHLLSFSDNSLDWAARDRAIRSIASLYQHLFQRICLPELTHLRPPGRPVSKANTLCYVFWDLVPLGPQGTPGAQQDAACLQVMHQSLQLPHCACQESALYGLMMWSGVYRQTALGEIAAFVERADASASPELLAWARRALDVG